MDIAGVSMALSAANTKNDVGVEMLANALDVQQAQGGAMVDMISRSAMETSVNPNVGSNFDVSV